MDRPNERVTAYDHVYALLVSLCDDDTHLPPANLLAAFNLVADTHVPQKLTAAHGQSVDAMLDQTLVHLRFLFATCVDLGEKTRLMALRLLLASVIAERGRPLGQVLGRPRGGPQ